MPNNLLEIIIKKENQKILSEIQKIDEKVALYGIEIPKTLDKKIEQLGISTVKRQKRKLYKKVSAFILVFLLSAEAILIFNPKITEGLKRFLTQTFIFQNKEAIQISIQQAENYWNNYTIYIPKDFKLSSQVDSFNTQKVTFTNEVNQFITINLYPEDFYISLDNENFDNYEDIIVDNYSAKLIIKNGITTILFFNTINLIEIESNLTKEETLLIAENILYINSKKGE